MRCRLAILALFAVLVPRPVSAQDPAAEPMQTQGQECSIEPRDNTRLTALNQNSMIFIGGGVFFRCEGGVTIQSDSLAYLEVTGIAEFIGNVVFQDTIKRLLSDYAQYMGRQRQLLAQGNVRLRDLKQGATLTAPHLNYFQPTDGRPESLIEVHSGRPHAVLVREGSEPGTMDTTVIDADAMTIVGESQFTGRGNVEIIRGNTVGYGQNALYDERQQLMVLSGAARLESEEFRLSGEEIRGRTDAQQQLREVEASREAVLEGENMRVDAPLVRVFFADGEVNRLIALGAARRPPEPGVEPAQAVAVSEEFRLVADSIDAAAPAQVLERVVAVGSALGEQIGQDSARAALPAVIARDWVRGDTIIATFTDAPPDTVAPADSVESDRPERVLETIVAIGAEPPASSVYRFPGDEGEEPAYNYMVANRISVQLAAGEVVTVEAEGQIRGVYLEPQPRTAASGEVRRSP